MANAVGWSQAHLGFAGPARGAGPAVEQDAHAAASLRTTAQVGAHDPTQSAAAVGVGQILGKVDRLRVTLAKFLLVSAEASNCNSAETGIAVCPHSNNQGQKLVYVEGGPRRPCDAVVLSRGPLLKMVTADTNGTFPIHSMFQVSSGPRVCINCMS